jgi:transposase
VVDIDESDKVCDCCQSQLHKIGESSSEALEFVPAHIKVIKAIRPKYTCRQCERKDIESVVKTALILATPIPKSIETPSLLSQIISCKYQFGLPLNRQETMFSDIGIELSRQTMSSWMLRSAQLLEPLYMRLKEVLLAESAIHDDETPLKVIKAEKRLVICGCIAAVVIGQVKKLISFYTIIITAVQHNARLTFLLATKVIKHMD